MTSKQRYRTSEKGRAENRERMRRRRALLTGAAARLRRYVDLEGAARCSTCDDLVVACCIDIDHIKPLAHGGTDTDDNVQALCRPCHTEKTRTELRAA